MWPNESNHFNGTTIILAGIEDLLDGIGNNMKLEVNYTGPLPNRLAEALEGVRSEDDALAADELVVLGEEILLHLAALGMAAYLAQDRQQAALNDFIADLFLSDGHQFNAGPIWRWVAHMVRQAEGPQVEALQPFFWKNGVLEPDVHHASDLRNMVMHGFFVLPPETNGEEAAKLCALLDRIGEAGLFTEAAENLHFIALDASGAVGFSGRWTAWVEEGDWERLGRCGAFGTKADRVALEFGAGFLKTEQFAMDAVEPDQAVLTRLSTRNLKVESAVLLAHRPGEDGVGLHAAGITALSAQGFDVTHFRIDPAGAAFTRDFVTRTLREKAILEGLKVKSKRGFEWYSQGRASGVIAQPWALAVDGIHWATGHREHLLNLLSELLEAGITLVASGWPLEEVASRFLHIESSGVPVLPDAIQAEVLLKNRVRFRGPDPERSEDREAYAQLADILNALVEVVRADGEVVARRFADFHGHPIEFVHEAMSALTACLHMERRAFEPAIFDPPYDFPKEMNESVQIYMALGRHDLKLEYRHRVLTIHPEA